MNARRPSIDNNNERARQAKEARRQLQLYMDSFSREAVRHITQDMGQTVQLYRMGCLSRAGQAITHLADAEA